MTKKELIAKIADDTGLAKKTVAAIVDETFDNISHAVSSGESVTIPGFGIFELRKRSGHMGVNPQTKEPVKVPDTVFPALRASKALKDFCSGAK